MNFCLVIRPFVIAVLVLCLVEGKASDLAVVSADGATQHDGELPFLSMPEPYPTGISPLLQKSRGGHGKPINLVLFGVILLDGHAGKKIDLAVIGPTNSAGYLYRVGDNVGIRGVSLKEIRKGEVVLSREEGDVLLLLNR